MHRVVGPARLPAVEQAQAPVGIALAMLEVAPHEAVAAGELVGRKSRRWRDGECRSNALLQALTHALIAIHAKHPVVAGLRNRKLLHRAEAPPFRRDHLGAELPGQGLRAVGTTGIDHHDFVAKRQRGERGPQLRGGIQGDQDGRER